MLFPFEAKYISINWAAKHSVRSILESRDAIKPEKLDDQQCVIEAITYSKIDDGRQPGQLAFHIPDGDNTYIPSFIKSSGDREPLTPINDPETAKVWWIEAGSWQERNGKLYRDSPVCRYAGEAKIEFGNLLCRIQIRSLSFSYEELDLYIKDFRNDLWDLILNDDSYISADAKTKKIKIPKLELFEHINVFNKFVQNILTNPKKELRESQSMQIAAKVRPIPRTFMEIATRGQSKFLTGRDYIESYDVAENRYVFGMVYRISALLDNLSKVYGQRKKLYRQNIESLSKRFDDFSEMIKIDKDVLGSEIVDLSEKIAKRKERLENTTRNQPQSIDSQRTIFIYLGRRDGIYSGKVSFYGKAKDFMGSEWWRFDQNSSLSLEFDSTIFDGVLEPYTEYRVTAYIREREHQGPNKRIYIESFENISNIEVVNCKDEAILKKHINAKHELKANNWIRSLKPQERKEQAQEKSNISRSISLLKREDTTNENIFQSLVPVSSKVKKIEQQFLKLKIRKNHHFPGSMTFIQNPNYQGAHKLFKEIIYSSGLDENLFESLLETEKIGVIDIPAIYERWCLLQLIKVLIEKFRFSPEDGWKQSLMNQVLTTNKNIVLNFKNEKTFRMISLSYEKELSNGKRPDFVLDVTSSFGKDHKSHRLVMDAKFYEEINISKVIDQLYYDKNYSENGKNKVFVLHPSPKAVPKRKTPQRWSINSYYGETSMLQGESEESYPDHKYGATLLSPLNKDGALIDDLQRLIGMFLQYGTENNCNVREDPMVQKRIFCIACGFDEYDYKSEFTKNRKGKKWNITCKNCSLFTVYSYCGSCKNRLVKNGHYWTYHATQALQPFNIKCPSCGDLAPPSDKNENNF